MTPSDRNVDSESTLLSDTAPYAKAASAGLLSGGRGLALGLVLGVLVAFVGSRLLPQQAEPDTAPSTRTVAQSVTTQQAQRALVNQTLTATGTVQAYDLLQVTPQASGLQIQDLRVRQGDRVTQGQVLAVLDDAVLQAQRREAQAALTQAQAQVRQQEAVLAQNQATLAEAEEAFGRYQNLYDRGAISQEQLTTRRTEVVTAREGQEVAIANIASAEANVASKQADIDRLETQLDQTLVRAPASGTVAERLATVGDTAAAGTAIYTLIQDDVLELAVKLPQTQLPQVSPGVPVEISSAADATLRLQGSVRTIDPTVDPETRQATVNISLPPSNQLRPGMFLQADIVTGQTEAVVVPAEALVPQADDTFVVFVVTGEGTAQSRTVEVGDRLPAELNQPARIEIRSGLEAGDTVVIEGASYLQTGDAVTVVEGLDGETSGKIGE